MRNRFDEQLEELNDHLLEMSALIEKLAFDLRSA